MEGLKVCVVSSRGDSRGRKGGGAKKKLRIPRPSPFSSPTFPSFFRTAEGEEGEEKRGGRRHLGCPTLFARTGKG